MSNGLAATVPLHCHELTFGSCSVPCSWGYKMACYSYDTSATPQISSALTAMGDILFTVTFDRTVVATTFSSSSYAVSGTAVPLSSFIVNAGTAATSFQVVVSEMEQAVRASCDHNGNSNSVSRER